MLREYKVKKRKVRIPQTHTILMERDAEKVRQFEEDRKLLDFIPNMQNTKENYKILVSWMRFFDSKNVPYIATKHSTNGSLWLWKENMEIDDYVK